MYFVIHLVKANFRSVIRNNGKNPFLGFTRSVRVFTREISSRNETHPGMKSSLSMVKYLLLFTRFWRDETSSHDELIAIKKTGLKLHPGMKKRKTDL